MERTEGDLSDELLPPQLVNRYAVPLGTLVGGTYVAHADQVVIHPQPGETGPVGVGSVSAAGVAGDGD